MDAMEPEGAWTYVLSGALYYEIGSTRHRVNAGQALVTRRPEPGWLLRPADVLPLNTLWIHVKGEQAMRIFDFLHVKFGQIQSLPLESEAVQLARNLVQLVADQAHRPAHFWSEKTFQWMNAWWKCAQENAAPTHQTFLAATKPSRLISFAPRSVKGFAAEMGYSRSYLSQKLRQQWGGTPGEVLRKVRLEEAARMLRSTKRSIREVAESVGYTSPAAFSRAFAKAYGQVPLAYRRSHL